MKLLRVHSTSSKQFWKFSLLFQIFILNAATQEIDYNVCSCDLQKSICNVNCCCDEDCSKDDKLVFSSCDDILPQFSDQLCSHPITTNGTLRLPEIAEDTVNDFLCIERDNNIERNFYTSDINQRVEELYRHLKNIPNYSNVLPITFPSSNENGIFGLPYSLFTNLCDSKTLVKFHQDQETQCVQLLRNPHTDCVENEDLEMANYLDIKFWGDEVEVKYLLCRHNTNYCQNGAILNPSIINNTYHNLVTEVHYIIHFEIPDTITKVVIKFVLSNLSLKDPAAPLHVQQKFSVSFEISENGEEIHLSGNPGYHKDKFIFAGWLQGTYIEYITTPWFQVPSEICSSWNLIPVRFGENIIASCIESVTDLKKSCKLISEINELLLYKNLPTHIGAYGNSNPDSFDDWVPLLIENKPNELTAHDCSSYISTVNIQIAYVQIGLESNPQAKIIGAKAEYTSSTEIWKSGALNGELTIPFFISVSFIDVSKEPEIIFAPLPIIDIKVPNDFFYPFESGQVKVKVYKYFIFITLIVFYIL